MLVGGVGCCWLVMLVGGVGWWSVVGFFLS